MPAASSHLTLFVTSNNPRETTMKEDAVIIHDSRKLRNNAKCMTPGKITEVDMGNIGKIVKYLNVKTAAYFFIF
jgi:hypothetical protein